MVIGDETCSQRLGQSNRRLDRQMRLWICLPQLKCRTIHTMTPNKLKDQNIEKEKETYVKFQMVCDRIHLHSYVYAENIIFKWSQGKSDYFSAFKDLFDLNVHFFHYKGSSYLRVIFFVSRSVALKHPKKDFRIKWYTAALSTGNLINIT